MVDHRDTPEIFAAVRAEIDDLRSRAETMHRLPAANRAALLNEIFGHAEMLMTLTEKLHAQIAPIRTAVERDTLILQALGEVALAAITEDRALAMIAIPEGGMTPELSESLAVLAYGASVLKSDQSDPEDA